MLIRSAALACAIADDLEGRLENMRDDDLQDTPDYIDASNAAAYLLDMSQFPRDLDLSDAETAQVAIAVENLCDFLDATDDAHADAETTHAELAAAGYYGRARSIANQDLRVAIQANTLLGTGDYPVKDMGAQESLIEAIAVLHKVCQETDPESIDGLRARGAKWTLNAILHQRGCEHLPDGATGYLVDVIDVIVFG